jgi:signal transduction histidine kinase
MTEVAFPSSDEWSRDRLEGLAILGELTSSVTHEFNNILNNILLHMAVLEQKGLSPELRQETAQVKQSSRQAAELVRRLQQYCQQQQPPSGPVDLNPLLLEAVEGQARLELAADLPPVLGHAGTLKRLVGLLLAHARAVSEGEIRIKTERCANGVAVHVEDQGPTLAAPLLAQQFHPFCVSRPGDDGIRLAVCKNLMRRLNGIIRAENRPEGGVAYVIELRGAGASR